MLYWHLVDHIGSAPISPVCRTSVLLIKLIARWSGTWDSDPPPQLRQSRVLPNELVPLDYNLYSVFKQLIFWSQETESRRRLMLTKHTFYC